jgi:hypothetical protein
VAEDGIEKSKKRPKSGTRMRVTHTRHVVYENLNQPSHPPTPDPDPVTSEVDERAVPDAAKAIAAAGNPVASPGGRSLTEARVSPPLTAGHQAPSSGDHGAAFADPMPGPRALALGHPDLRQSSTSFDTMLAKQRTVNGDNANGDRGVTYTAGEVALNLFNARGQAGQYRGMGPVGHSPDRPDWHQARGSATPPNGTHGLSDPGSHAAPQAMKGSEAREVMRRALFGGNGAR